MIRMGKKKIVVLGAGLAGLSAAWHLQKNGVDCSVFEKEPCAGGLCRSRRINGFTFDCDGHLLHFRNKYSRRLISGLLGSRLVAHRRSAWVSSFGTFIRYPFQANLNALPEKVAEECLVEFLKASLPSIREDKSNLLKWINGAFGTGIARHFMIPYNKKFWTVPLSGMSADWTVNFVPRPEPLEVIAGFFGAGRRSFGYNTTFWYPRRAGINQLPLAFERRLRNVFKDSPVESIDLKKKILHVAGMGEVGFDILISTMPLPELPKIARPLPALIRGMFGKLRWNSIFNLNLGVEGVIQKGRHWVYFPQKETVFFRAGFFHNFSGDACPPGKSSIYTEVAYSSGRPLEKREIARKIISGLRDCGVLGPDNAISVMDENDIKYGYPIYDMDYSRAISAINAFLLRNGIITCGRYGSWRYMSMEDAVLDGARSAEMAIR